jgi:hypothetical protein
MLIIDVVIKIVLNRYIRTSEAVVPLYNLDVEHLCTSSENTRKHCIKYFLLNSFFFFFFISFTLHYLLLA